MKAIRCVDMGMKGCPFVATGKTGTEAKRKMMAHAKKMHASILKKASPMQQKKMMEKMDKLLMMA